MTGRLEYLIDFKGVTNGGNICFGNDANGTIRGNGSLTTGNLPIQRVAYVQCLKQNLISVRKICKAGHHVEFNDE